MQQPSSSSTSVVMAADVGARAVSDSLTRQDNETEYAAGDVLAAMAGEPLAAVPLVFAVGRAAGATPTPASIIAPLPDWWWLWKFGETRPGLGR